MSSLFVIGGLGRRFDPNVGELALDPTSGGFRDIGFADDGETVLHGRPPRLDTPPYDGACRTTFLSIRPDDRLRRLARVEVAEAFVFDFQMRGEIDFTGLQVTLFLHTDAYLSYLAHLGPLGRAAMPGAGADWDGALWIRTLSAPFAFPSPRGSDDPWNTGAQGVGVLRQVSSFTADRMEIQLLRDRAGHRVDIDDALAGRGECEPPLILSTAKARVWGLSGR
ncbi:hypothetical protein BH09PSE1_BH09PSE1_12700 [soil metagenome]